jgi:DNA-binding XRE family transcriptional regulator
MRKNFIISIQAKYIIKTLLKQGYTKSEIARMADLNERTVYNIMEKEFVTLKTDKKLKDMFVELGKLIEKEQTKDSYFLTDEDVIDRKDAEEGAKEVAKWMWLSLGIAVCILVALIFVIKYVISLF